MTALTIPNLAQLEKWKALEIKVISPETKLAAEEHLVQIHKAGTQLIKDIKTLKQPYKDAIDKVDAATKPWKELLDSRKDALGRALMEYNAKIRKQVEEANAKALLKYETKVEKVETKAIEQGRPIPLVLPPILAAAPPKTEAVDGGRLTTVKRKAWRIASTLESPETLTRARSEVKDVPDEYFILDTARIGKVVRAGGSIPGIEIVEEESISVMA
jgi:hypothetical protein